MLRGILAVENDCFLRSGTRVRVIIKREREREREREELCNKLRKQHYFGVLCSYGMFWFLHLQKRLMKRQPHTHTHGQYILAGMVGRS